VPIVPELRKALLERWLGAGRPAEGLVFKSSKGGLIDLHNLRSRHFAAILRRARIHWASCTKCDAADLSPRAKRCPRRGCGAPTEQHGRALRIYDLRHGFATAALEAGADVRTVADLMGHSSTRITQDVYQHVSSERKREAAEMIAERLSQ